MSVLLSQSVISYVEEENIPALKALLEKCKDVDERNEVSPPLLRSRCDAPVGLPAVILT